MSSSDSYDPGDFIGNACDALVEVALDHDRDFHPDVTYEQFAEALRKLMDHYFTEDELASPPCNHAEVHP